MGKAGVRVGGVFIPVSGGMEKKFQLKRVAVPSEVAQDAIDDIAGKKDLLNHCRHSRVKIQTKYDETPGRIKRMEIISKEDLEKWVEKAALLKDEYSIPKKQDEIYYYLLIRLIRGDFFKRRDEIKALAQEDFLSDIVSKGFLEEEQTIYSIGLFKLFLELERDQWDDLKQLQKALSSVGGRIFKLFFSWGFLERYRPRGEKRGVTGFIYSIDAEKAEMVKDFSFSQLKFLNKSVGREVLKKREELRAQQAIEAKTDEDAAQIDGVAKENVLDDLGSIKGSKSVLILEDVEEMKICVDNITITAEGVHKITITPV